MKKSIGVLLLAILFSCFLFAQTSEGFSETSLSITDSDCKNFAKNYKKIYADIEKYQDDLESGKAVITTDNALDSILVKNGISNPNPYMKMVGILNAYGVIKYEKELKADPLAAAVLKKSGTDPAKEMRLSIGKSDYDVVAKNFKAIAIALDDEAEEPEKRDDPTIGGLIGGSIGGKKGDVLGKGVDTLIKKKGKSEKIVDHINKNNE